MSCITQLMVLNSGYSPNTLRILAFLPFSVLGIQRFSLRIAVNAIFFFISPEGLGEFSTVKQTLDFVSV